VLLAPRSSLPLKHGTKETSGSCARGFRAVPLRGTASRRYFLPLIPAIFAEITETARRTRSRLPAEAETAARNRRAAFATNRTRHRDESFIDERENQRFMHHAVYLRTYVLVAERLVRD